MLMTNGTKTIEVVKTAETFTITYDINTTNLRYHNVPYIKVIESLINVGYRSIKGCKRVVIDDHGITRTIYARRITFTDIFMVILDYKGDELAYNTSKYGIYIKGVI